MSVGEWLLALGLLVFLPLILVVSDLGKIAKNTADLAKSLEEINQREKEIQREKDSWRAHYGA